MEILKDILLLVSIFLISGICYFSGFKKGFLSGSYKTVLSSLQFINWLYDKFDISDEQAKQLSAEYTSSLKDKK